MAGAWFCVVVDLYRFLPRGRFGVFLDIYLLVKSGWLRKRGGRGVVNYCSGIGLKLYISAELDAAAEHKVHLSPSTELLRLGVRNTQYSHDGQL